MSIGLAYCSISAAVRSLIGLVVFVQASQITICTIGDRQRERQTDKHADILIGLRPLHTSCGGAQ